MNVGDLFELLFVLAIILFGLLGGKKKKPPERRTTGSAPSRGPEAFPAGTGVAVPDEPGFDDLARELDRVLRGQSRPEFEPAPPSEVPEPAGVRSLEEPDIDSDERHRRFHEQYISPLAPPAPLMRSPVPGRPGLPGTALERIPLRQAVIWREILGPPKGLR